MITMHAPTPADTVVAQLRPMMTTNPAPVVANALLDFCERLGLTQNCRTCGTPDQWVTKGKPTQCEDCAITAAAQDVTVVTWARRHNQWAVTV